MLAPAPQNDRLCDAMMLGVAVQRLLLTDDELWRAIAENTNAMSALVHQRVELDAEFVANDPDRQAKLMRSNMQTVDTFQRQYRDYIAELRRRYPAI
jgi:hypothetical protein